MDILSDIKNILIDCDDRDHNLKINIEQSSITVYLDYDPYENYRELCMIPIRCDVSKGIAYIPHDEFKKLFNVESGGIELEELDLVKKIMEYMTNNMKSIKAICDGYGLAYRQD